MTRRLSHVIGFDDAPFIRSHRGDVPIVGAIYAGTQLHGIVFDRVRRDGANATDRLSRVVGSSRFRSSLQAVMLQGIALAGFNVIDLPALHVKTGLPVLVVVRRPPKLPRIRRALSQVPGGERKWRLIEKAGPMEACGGVWVQRAGLSPKQARELLTGSTRSGNLPEPIRTAHLVADALVRGESRSRA